MVSVDQRAPVLVSRVLVYRRRSCCIGLLQENCIGISCKSFVIFFLIYSNYNCAVGRAKVLISIRNAQESVVKWVIADYTDPRMISLNACLYWSLGGNKKN